MNGHKVFVGVVEGFAVYQSENKRYADYRERARAYRQRKTQRTEQDYYASIGEWSPADELPDPDEVQSQDD